MEMVEDHEEIIAVHMCPCPILAVPAQARTSDEVAGLMEECDAGLEEARLGKEEAVASLAKDDREARRLEAEKESLEEQIGKFEAVREEAREALEKATPRNCLAYALSHLKAPRYVRFGIEALEEDAAFYEERMRGLEAERQDVLRELAYVEEKRESDLVALYRSRDGIASLEAEAEELRGQYEEALAEEKAAEEKAAEERAAEEEAGGASKTGGGQASSPGGPGSPGSGGSGTGSGGSSSGSSVSQEMAQRGGMAGRLSIPSTGTSVALFYCDYSDGDRNQAITDAKDSAAYIPHEGGIIIADHVNQAFSGLKNVSVGTAMTIDYGSYTQAYTCMRTCTGTNYNGHLYDSDGNVIHSWLKGRIVLYTCQGGGVLITFWE